MAESQKSRDVSAKEAIACIRGPMTNAQVMEQFRITPSGFADLLKQLFMRKLISEEDLQRRGIRFKVVKAESPQHGPEPIPLIPPEPMEENEEFLNTVELTEMLSFKPQVPPKDEKEPQSPEGAPPKPEEDGDPSDKKGKFRIPGFFRKAR